MKKIDKVMVDSYMNNSFSGSLITGSGASIQELLFVENELKIKLPQELLDLYRIYNGFGVETKDGKFWALHPLSGYVEFILGIRDSFSTTHPKAAERFLPVFDWNDGDAVGYLLNNDGTFKVGLYEFSHDDYEYSSKQPVSEFIARCDESIGSFLEINA